MDNSTTQTPQNEPEPPTNTALSQADPLTAEAAAPVSPDSIAATGTPRTSSGVAVTPFARFGHIEQYTIEETNELIRLTCYCELLQDHTYQEWVAAGLNSHRSITKRRRQQG